MEKIKLNKVIEPFGSRGFFRSFLQLDPQIEWLDSDTAVVLDKQYILQHSGKKYISGLVKECIEAEDSEIINDWVKEVAEMILLSNKDNWNKVYDAYVKTAYEPLENYSMVEDENVNSNVHNTITNNSGTYGFNSSEPVPKDSVVSTSDTTGDFDDNHRQLKRAGNIGVTTSQQMLQSEIELRKFNFYQSIMNVIDNYVCLKIY